jgi:hypothetical protein
VPFQLTLAAPAEEFFRAVKFEVELRRPEGVSGLVYWPPVRGSYGFEPGSVMTASLESDADSLVGFAGRATVDLFGMLTVRDHVVGFSVRNIDPADHLYLAAVSRQYFLGHVLHRRRAPAPAPGRCVVRCENSDEWGQECVTCTQDGITIKVCC